MDSSRISTGWFGIPGGPEHKSTGVHVVLDGKPVCGTRMGFNQEFQWCADGAVVDYIECRRCKLFAERMLAKKLTDEVREGFR